MTKRSQRLDRYVGATWQDSFEVAVFDAYGWPDDLGDEEIPERLLALNLERAGRQA